MHPSQCDVYVDQLLHRKSPHYNIGGYIKLKGKLNLAKFTEAVNSAALVFDAFKMRFDFELENFNITVDAVATNLALQQASNAGNPASIDVVPVADLVDISFATPGGDEDTAIPVNISLALTDLNGTVNEQIQEPIVITVGLGATLLFGGIAETPMEGNPVASTAGRSSA